MAHESLTWSLFSVRGFISYSRFDRELATSLPNGLERRDTDHIVIALGDGGLTWQKELLTDSRPGWAPGGDLVSPAALRNAFTAEPVWADFREQASHARDQSSAAIVEFMLGALLDDPHRLGGPL